MPTHRLRTGSTGVMLILCCLLLATAVIGATGRRSLLRGFHFRHFPWAWPLEHADANRASDELHSRVAAADQTEIRRQPPSGRIAAPTASLPMTRDQPIALTTHQLSNEGLLVGRFGVLAPATGQFIPTNELQVSFFRDGRPVASQRPGADGLIRVKLKPAIYSVVATGLGGTAVHRLRVVDADTESTGQPDPFEVAVVPLQDLALVKLLLQRRGPAAGPSNRQQKQTSNRTPNRAASPLAPVAIDTPANPHYVQLHAGGLLTGRIGWLDSESRSLYALERVDLFIIKNGHLEAQVYTDPQGYFSVGNLRPGRHSIIGFGGNVPGTDTRFIEGGLITLSVYLTLNRDFELVHQPADGESAIELFLVKLVQAAPGVSSLSVNIQGAHFAKTTATREAVGGWSSVIDTTKSRSQPDSVAPVRPSAGGRATAGIAGVLAPFAEVDQTTDRNPASTGFTK